VTEPFFFEHDQARLFGVLDCADAGSPSAGVVFCHPFGEEKQLTDRVFVRFARRLAASGFATLRFDCRGYGESQGELEDGTLESHVSQTLAAAELLKSRYRLRSVLLLGLRFGATVAALAAERAPDVSGLILWSPIVSGRAYARELIRKKLAEQLALQDQAPTREQLLETLKTEGRLEFDGGYLTQPMYDALSTIDLPQQVKQATSPVFVSTIRQRNQSYAAYDGLVNAYRSAGGTADLVVAEEREYWDVRSMFDAFFPDELYGATLDWAQARWRIAS